MTRGLPPLRASRSGFLVDSPVFLETSPPNRRRLLCQPSGTESDAPPRFGGGRRPVDFLDFFKAQGDWGTGLQANSRFLQGLRFRISIHTPGSSGTLNADNLKPFAEASYPRRDRNGRSTTEAWLTG